MLNSNYIGLSRLGNTLGNQWNNSRFFDGYTAAQTKATAEAVFDLPYNDPNKIGNRYEFYHKVNGQWHYDIQSPVHGESNPMSQKMVADSDKIRELNAISTMRDERNHQSDFDKNHNKDPNKDIAPSKQTIADNRNYGQEQHMTAHQPTPQRDVQSDKEPNPRRERFEQLFAAVMGDDDVTTRHIQKEIMNSEFGQQFVAQAKVTVAEQDRQVQDQQAQLAQQAEIDAPARRGPVMRMS
jgi:hypothetical protein